MQGRPTKLRDCLSKPKSASKGITIYLQDHELEDIDRQRDEALSQLPAEKRGTVAKLSRKAWVEQLVRTNLHAPEAPKARSKR